MAAGLRAPDGRGEDQVCSNTRGPWRQSPPKPGAPTSATPMSHCPVATEPGQRRSNRLQACPAGAVQLPLRRVGAGCRATTSPHRPPTGRRSNSGRGCPQKPCCCGDQGGAFRPPHGGCALPKAHLSERAAPDGRGRRRSADGNKMRVMGPTRHVNQGTRSRLHALGLCRSRHRRSRIALELHCWRVPDVCIAGLVLSAGDQAATTFQGAPPRLRRAHEALETA